MHGQKGGDTGKRFQLMWSVPSLTTPSTDDSDCCFFKDGRKISVGDCALFQPQQDSPAFIGVIRCFSSLEETNLSLSVNWLYRPSEVKLAKGGSPVSAPNEVFYSFHSDIVSSVSLLHPCKVAFLPKGVELPASVPSFVCRRVYDIDHNCLWWLTDRDYIHGHQKEIKQLLHKTRIEMHATAHLQQGTRSAKPVNGSSTVFPLKHSSESVQHSPSHTKRKKRERGEQTIEHIKLDQSVRPEEGDSDSGQLRSVSNLKLEIAKISERGGLVDSEMVVRLIQLMQRKIDLRGRSMLAGIIAGTENVVCLNKFVQLKGLLLFDEWLQEVRRGKIRDRGSVKDGGDVCVESFLLVLLHALDKLPVNLKALQMCNIGKSVNHLRSHRNIEIQKKARSLVDTWKKRVEVEMNMNDAKFGAGRSPSVKRVQENPNSKSAFSSRNKDEQAQLSANCVQEKSTVSSHSHSNSRCSSGHVKNTMPSIKEDVRSFGKATRNESKHRKPSDVNGVDASVPDAKCHKLIVKIPNRSRIVPDACKCSSSVDGLSSSVPRSGSNDNGRSPILSEAVTSPSGNEKNPKKALDSCFSSMNALVESCIKFSEANASLSCGDDVGMNLLASVAAREVSKSASVSPNTEPEGVEMKGNGNMDEKGGIPCSLGTRVSDDSTEIANEKSVSDGKSRDQILVGNQRHGDSLVADDDEAKDEVSHSSSNLYDVRNNVSRELQNSVITVADILVEGKSESNNTNENTAVVSSCTVQEPVAGNLHDMKSGKANSGDISDRAGLDHNCSVEDNNTSSQMPLKLEELVPAPIWKEQNDGCMGEYIENDSSANSVNSPAVVNKEAEASLNTKGSDVDATEESRKDDVATIETQVKLGFDLNEGFSMDDGRSAEPALGSAPFLTSPSNVGPSSITVAAPAKGSFVPLDDLLKNKTEIGWKGSAATSAFRPTEPRRLSEASSGPNKPFLVGPLPCKQAKPPLDIDLNVADERVSLDVGGQTSGQEPVNRNHPMYDLNSTTLSRCSVGFDLDLNKADEVADMVTPSIIFSNGEKGGRRDFDLNNGFSADETPVEKTLYNQHNCRNIPYYQGPFGPRIYSSDAGNCFPWYSVSMGPSASPETAGGPQRITGGSPTSNLSFNPDNNNYQGSMMLSTRTVPFTSTPFQYPVFPCGSSFPLSTPGLFGGGPSGFVAPFVGGRVSAIPPQLIGTASTVPFQYPHAYAVSHPNTRNNNAVTESNQKRGKQGLDLNSGPGGADVEGRYESRPIVSRHVSAISTQSLGDEQAEMYNMGGGILKRKEPDGGWNVDKNQL